MRGESPHSGGLRRKSHLDLLLGVLMVVLLWGCGMSVSAASATVPSTAIRYTYTPASQLSAVIKPEAEYGLYTWDAAGNLSSVAKKSSTKLSIIELEPSKGAVGETVDIWGTGFSSTPSNDTVKFDGTAATVSTASAYELAVKVPSGAKTGTVTVQTTTEGPVTSSQTFTVTSAVGAPTITSLSTSVTTAGSEITINGSNFEPSSLYNNVVTVNRAMPELLSESATAIKFKVPSATGSGPVKVATPQGSAVGPELFIPPNAIAPSRVGATGEISLGGTKTVTVSNGAANVALTTFQGIYGQRVSLLVSEETLKRGNVSLWTPEGKKIAGTEVAFVENETVLAGAATLPATGTYTVLIQPEGEDTGSVKLSAYGFSDVKGEIKPSTKGVETSVSIADPGQRASYSVSGTAGESVSLKTTNTTINKWYYLEWLNTEGKEISSESFRTGENGFMRQVKFPTTGTYTLLVHAESYGTGSVTVTAYEANDVTGTIAPTSEGESKTVTISVPGQYARYSLSGKEGQRVSLLVSEAMLKRGYVSLITPEGKKIVNEESFNENETVMGGPVTLPATGTYTVLIEPQGEDTGSLKLSAYGFSDVKGEIKPSTKGVETSVSTADPGQRAYYSVSGTAGESVSLKTTNTTINKWYYLEWLNPEGKEIARESFRTGENGFMRQVKFPTTGTYTLVVYAEGYGTGSVAVTAYEANDVTGTITPTSEGESKTVTISIPGQYARYTFSGKEGQTVTLKAKESTITDGWMSVWNPEGSKVSGSEANFSGSGASVEITLSATGTYTILLEPEGEDTGSVKLTAYLGSHPNVLRRPADSSGSVALPRPEEKRPVKAVGLESAVAQQLESPTTGSVAVGLAGGGQAPVGALKVRTGATRRTGLSGRLQPSSGARWAYLSTREVRRVAQRAGAGRLASRGSLRLAPEIRDFKPRNQASWQPAGGSALGKSWDSGAPVSPWTKVASLEDLDGTTALSGQVLAQNGLPLPGVRVAIGGTDVAASTDEAGRFLLSGAPAGHQVLVIEGESTRTHVRYGAYEAGVEITAGETTVLPYTIWLTPLDPAGDRGVASPTRRETRITTPQIPGLEVRLPAGTVIHDAAGQVVHKLNITAIPVDRPPFPLPFFSEVPVYFTVQPGRAYLSKGAQIVYPNYGHLRPGARVDFWNYDAAGRGWYIYGQGTVTPNGKQVMPDPGVRVWEFTGAMITNTPKPPGSAPTPEGLEGSTNAGGGGPGTGVSGSTEASPSNGGDPVNLRSGLLVYRKPDLVIPDTIPIVIERTYRPGDSNSYSFGVGTTSFYDLRLWSENNYHEAYLVLPSGGKILYKRISPGEGYSEAEYKASETPGVFYDSTIKWDSSEPGWELTLTNGTTYVFGENAPLQAIRNKQGQQLTLTRENGLTGNITQITSPHGHWVKLTYNSSSAITEIKDNVGRTLKYTYNKAGLLESASDPAGRTTKYEYNSEGDMTSITDPRGNKYLETAYNSNGTVSKQTLANSGTYEFSYTVGGGKVESVTVTEPRGNKRKVTFNSEGYPTSETAGLGSSVEQTTTFERQAGTGFLLSSTDARSRKTAYEYNSYGNVIAVTRLAGTSSAQTYKYAYEPDTTEVTKVTDPLGHATTNEYNSLGELTASKDALGHTTNYEYNGDGQPTIITNPLGKKSTITYENGAPAALTDPLGRTTKQFVDAAGRVLATTLPGSQRTTSEYNNDNQVTKMTDPAGNATSYEYDADGNLTATTDPLKHKSTYAYTKMDLVESETDPLEKKTSVAYDTEGNVIELTDRRGKVDKFTYDALNRLTEAKYGVSGETAESTIKYEYDNGNRPTKVIDSAGGTYTPEYDELNRMKSLATPQGTIKYEYDETNRRTSMTVPGQEALKYTYDEANRLKELKRGTQVVTFAYNEDNLPTTITLPDGVEKQYGYDEANELTSIAYKKGATTLGELDYAYDLDGHKEAMWGSYARTALPEAFSSAKYNADNEQTERGSKKISYDANGNLTSDGANEYKWNARNQLASITGAIKATYGYDPFGRRTTRTLGSTTTELLYDDSNVVQEIQGGSATANVLTGPLPDEVFARTTSKTTESLLTDAVGSTIALAGSTGSVETKYTYDPFGTTTTEGTASGNTTQYAGQEDEGNGIYYDRARYYNPAAARFISQDPLRIAGGGINLYSYVADNPINEIDRLGTTREPLETVPVGQGCTYKELEREEAGLPREPCKEESANLEAPTSSGGWGNVACQVAIVIPGTTLVKWVTGVLVGEGVCQVDKTLKGPGVE